MRPPRLAPLALAACVLLPLLAGCGPLRVFFPAKTYETEPPELPADLGSPAILLFTKTNGFRHEEAIPAGVARIGQIAAERGWSVFHTENGATFNDEYLRRFAVAVWLNTSGDTLNDAQKDAFSAWLESGGGFVGVHGTGGDTSYDWAWHVEELVRAQFIGHTMGPQFQEATVQVEVSDHPATRALPASFPHVEEWYSFEQSPRERVTVLATVDERSYSPRFDLLWMDEDLSMGDHPILWHHCVGAGRALYSALGHQAAAYDDPEVVAILEGAIAWAAGVEGEGCESATAGSR